MSLSGPQSDVSIGLVEFGLTAILIGISYCFPSLGSSLFRTVEWRFRILAGRHALSVVIVGASAILLRLAILPWVRMPLPSVPDDFSFLLAADTFASGRLANPTPAMWTHFETIHVTMLPTYASMYFPGQGLLLAAAKVLTGNPWFGVLVSAGIMCSALTWMLQAWVPPGWALLGGVLAIFRLGMFSYWINTYHTGAPIAATGGALILGALPRLRKRPESRYFACLGIGISLLAISRPYEGLLLCIPAAFFLALWFRDQTVRATGARILLRRAAFPTALVIATLGWMGYYNYRAFGNPLTPPYKIDRATYAIAPYFVWQAAKPAPLYRHASIRRFYESELPDFHKVHDNFLSGTVVKAARGVQFFSGIALLVPLIMLGRVFRDRRTRFLVICAMIFAVGMSIEVFLIPYYLAPFTAAFYAIGLQAMRHLRVWRPGGQSVGRTMVRLTVVSCVVLAAVRVYAGPLHVGIPDWPQPTAPDGWYGPPNHGRERAAIESRLEKLPGPQLAIVRYSAHHFPLDEWVYNAADIDDSKVIWARDMDASQNLELIRYYKDRQVWLVEPDSEPARISPYSIPLAGAAGER